MSAIAVHRLRAIAILCVRNEEQFIGRAIRHLIDQGLGVAVIDNDSTDSTGTILSEFSSNEVIYRERLKYEGYFDLARSLAAGISVARHVAADWIVAQAADEILQSPYSGEKLYDSLNRVDRTEANVVNCHEFVFVPKDPEQDFSGRDYVREMSSYYFFQPKYPRLMRIFRSHLLYRPELCKAYISSGGHVVQGSGIKLHPKDFILRHYPALSLQALKRKYLDRRFVSSDQTKAWHHNRLAPNWTSATLPPPERLKRLQTWDSCKFDTSDPWVRHFWESPRE